MAPGADLLAVGHQPGERQAVLEKHKRHILVVSAVDAIGEVPRRFGDGDSRLFHKIRLSDFSTLSIWPVRGHWQRPRRIGSIVFVPSSRWRDEAGGGSAANSLATAICWSI